MLIKVGSQRRPPEDCIRVLAIENDEDDCYFLSRMLEQDARKYYELETTDILQAGIDILKHRQFDCVILDLGLDESQGLETLELLLDEKFTVPIIVLTGSNQISLGEGAIKAGAEDFIPKFDASSSLLTRSITYAIERHRLLLQLHSQAYTDTLTRLPNRASFYDRIESLVIDAERRALNFGVAMMDLDHFKEVNDTYGHRAGDDLLQHVAARLQKNLRKSDMVARLGGDEFIFVVTHYHNTDEFLGVLKKKKMALQQPVSIFAEEAVHIQHIGASIGACEWQNGISTQKLISLADKAMYASKQAGKGEIVLYSAITEKLHATKP